MERLLEIIPQFSFEGTYLSFETCTTGHINETYFLDFQVESKVRRYVLQYINSNVFREPERVMENIEAVTSHLRKKVMGKGGDPQREAIQIIPTKTGASFYVSSQGEYWRAYDFIEGARTYQAVENPLHFFYAGRTFGQFQLMLADFPADTLHETIVKFHDTHKRFGDLLDAIQKDPLNRAHFVREEIAFVLAREEDTRIILDLMEAGKIPLRVTHNDTKFNNIMIDDQSGEGICVLDLDTVMPGSALYDFGDSIRFGASTALEDETNLDLVSLDLDLYTAFARGYLGAAQDFLYPEEIKHLAFSAKLLTLETGIRFLEDYIRGDVYFRIEHPSHNLDRARTQFKLVADMEAKMPQMEQIIYSILAENRKEGVS